MVNQLGGSEGMLLCEILKLISSEIARNMYFPAYFCINIVFKEGKPSYMKRGLLLETLKSGGTSSLCPLVPTFMLLLPTVP